MLRLVETDFASTRKPDLGHQTPACFFDVRAPDVLLFECRYLDTQIVAHEIKLVAILVSGVYGDFRWRQREDQPIVTSIYR